MGNKQGSRRDNSTSLSTAEKRRLTTFLEERKSSTKFTSREIERLWRDLLVPDLLQFYSDFLLKSNRGHKDFIGLEEFTILYLLLVRGVADDKARAISKIIGSKKINGGQQVISFQDLCKYSTDLLESYYLGLKSRNDILYKSWTNIREPGRNIAEQVIRGLCNDMQRNNDEVTLEVFENWLLQAGFLTQLHTYVLGSLYNLEPETKSKIIPHAVLPTTKIRTILDLSQVFYLNSFLPSPFKEQWRFLFSTLTHGESFSNLVGCIGNQGPILMVIKTNEDHTFGGFISTNLFLGPKWTGSIHSFLFKLIPEVEIFPATGYNDHYAYLNMNQSTLPNGLGMGGQFSFWGLWIDSHFGIGECSESCTTFKNYRMLNPKKKFQIKYLEVWGVGEPPPIEEGERRGTRRGTRSVLDTDPTSTHIMEMAGRVMHSKGIRDSLGMKEGETQHET